MTTLADTYRALLAARLEALDAFDIQTRAMLAESDTHPVGTFPARATERDAMATRALESARFLLALLP